jgi:eukaryotic-like serine/threonine-protein kinase
VDELVFGRRYRATEKIGTGGMADVYKAVDDVLGRTVAVKVMHPRYAADPNFAHRFRQEAQAAAQLQSPNIVNMYDWGQDGDTYYIVMEYVRGNDLKSIIEQKGALPSRKVAEIGAQVCSALAVAHGYDIIHRDIKPHNIMVQPDGTVKVMDFGIARAGNSTMTQTGSVLGTAHYVSPEQAQGKPLTASTDLYSLGVVLYEAATGNVPFDADTPVAVALKQVNENPVRPSQLNPQIDHGLESVIGRAMDKRVDDRYSSADEMRRDLIKVIQGEAVGGAAAVSAFGAGTAMGVGGGVGAAQMMDETAVLPTVGGGYEAGGGVRRVAPAPKKKMPVWPWILVLALLVAVGLGVAFSQGLLGVKVISVPDVKNTDVATAKSTLEQQGFVVGDITEEFDDIIAKGNVISESPIAGVPAKKGTVVSLVVSKGQDLVVVPDLKGMTQEEADAALSDAGLTGTAGSTEYSTKTAAKLVMKQDPVKDTQVVRGSTVTYVISLGTETLTVPNVVGKKKSSAITAITDAGFKYSVTYSSSSSVADGVVISQDPSAKSLYAKGSTVKITVSTGPKLVKVPDLNGQTEAGAKAKLEALGLKMTVTYNPVTSSGQVVDQTPAAGKMVNPGSTVNVEIDGPDPSAP